MSNLKIKFTENAEQFDSLMMEMLEENDYLKNALDTISSGFGETKHELENYAEQKLIDIEKGERPESQQSKINRYEVALNRIVNECTARKAVMIAKNALPT